MAEPPVPPAAPQYDIVLGGCADAAQPTTIRFRATPSQFCLLLALWPDARALLSALADGSQPCSRCGDVVDIWQARTLAEHGIGRCAPPRADADTAPLDAVRLDFEQQCVRLAWFDVALALPLPSPLRASAAAYLHAETGLLAEARRRAAPRDTLRGARLTYRLAARRDRPAGRRAQELLEHLRQLAAADGASPLCQAADTLTDSWSMTLVVDALQLTPATKLALRRAVDEAAPDN